jgi:chloramphenicol-sensitive protein RarD
MSKTPHHPEAARGALAAAACFTFWGLIPVYWKWLEHVGSLELIAHRAVWSLVFLVAILAWQKRLPVIRDTLRDPRALRYNFITGALLLLNWLAFIWAVNHGRVLESSLGYFLVPLFNVAMGFIVFHERPRPVQWVAIALAAAGVGFLLIGVGQIPWVAIAIVLTWGTYGMVRKKSPMEALDGLTVETLLFLPLAAGYLAWLALHGRGALGHVSVNDHILIFCAGWITAIPLLWFAYGARRIRLTTLGLLQYIAPSVQFLLGYFAYREPFDEGRMTAYGLIWCGLILYTVDSFWSQRRVVFK